MDMSVLMIMSLYMIIILYTCIIMVLYIGLPGHPRDPFILCRGRSLRVAHSQIDLATSEAVPHHLKLLHFWFA